MHDFKRVSGISYQTLFRRKDFIDKKKPLALKKLFKPHFELTESNKKTMNKRKNHKEKVLEIIINFLTSNITIERINCTNELNLREKLFYKKMYFLRSLNCSMYGYIRYLTVYSHTQYFNIYIDQCQHC